MREQWQDIKGWEGLYRVSNKGRVFSIRRGKCLKPNLCGYGYLAVKLCQHMHEKDCRIARLVGLHFIPNPENKPQINHKDGVKTNNNVSNLEWNTLSENRKHAFRIGLRDMRGEKHSQHKLTESDIFRIRTLYPAGMRSKDLAKMFNVTYYHINAIIRRRAWSHI